MKSEIELLLGVKGLSFPRLYDHDWMCDSAFCIDVAQHLDEVNVSLEEVNHLM